MVSFPFVGGEGSVNPDDIIYVQTDGHRNVFYFYSPKGKTLRAYMKLDEIERRLCRYGFIRCHRSCLINLRYASEVRNYLVALTNGEVFTISRKRYQAVKEAYKEYTSGK